MVSRSTKLASILLDYAVSVRESIEGIIIAWIAILQYHSPEFVGGDIIQKLQYAHLDYCTTTRPRDKIGKKKWLGGYWN
eukprot:scaffold391_cov40-Attheya_sp.AAC.1